MRTLVFFLVFANLAAFVLSGGVAERTPAPTAEDGRAHAQLSPDRIRIVSKGAPPDVSAPPEPPCFAWLDLPREAAEKLQAAVAAESALKLRREESTVIRRSYWVHIPPNGSGRAGAERKISELRQLGIKDYFLMAEPGVDQWAISLGLFSSETLANNALAALQQKGVRSARLAARENSTHKPVWRVQGPAEKLEPLRTLLDPSLARACSELAPPSEATPAAKPVAGANALPDATVPASLSSPLSVSSAATPAAEGGAR
jgi:hypothetical protein